MESGWTAIRLKPIPQHRAVMAAMERVDSPGGVTRSVFLAAAAASLTSASSLLFGTLVASNRKGIQIDLSAMRLLADGGSGGLVLLVMSLALLWPAYLSLMSSVGMWQSRERMQAAAGIVLIVLASVMLSSWRWITSAQSGGDEWSVGFGLIGVATGSVAFLGLWRAGMWLLDSPYRE